MPIELLSDGPAQSACRLILAHGAGQAMDSPFMQTVAQHIGSRGIRVIRFNFPYMQQAIASGRRRPPDREPRLLAFWREMIAQQRAHSPGPLFIGGKSMGGRIASLLADEQDVSGLICLGYPFHPPGKAERLRISHLAELRTPTLICQGERDSFGRRDEVADYPLASAIHMHWLPDGDHSFKPRKASRISQEQNLHAAAEACVRFIQSLVSV